MHNAEKKERKSEDIKESDQPTYKTFRPLLFRGLMLYEQNSPKFLPKIQFSRPQKEEASSLFHSSIDLADSEQRQKNRHSQKTKNNKKKELNTNKKSVTVTLQCVNTDEKYFNEEDKIVLNQA